MSEDRLKIVAVDKKGESPSSVYAGGKNRRLEVQALWDRLWLQNPHAHDPQRNGMERLRLERTMALITATFDLEGKKACDLGCGKGDFARVLCAKGAQVDAVDISPNALKLLAAADMHGMQTVQDYVPMTKLRDNAYALVACLDLIAELRDDEHRLLFSELARLVTSDGYVVCSSSLDINSEDALPRFVQLAESELNILHSSVSYHRLWIRLKSFLKAPSRYYRARQDPAYRQRQLKERSPCSQVWFKLQSTPLLAPLWGALAWLLKPAVYFVKNNRTLLLTLEQISKFFWSDAGITHAILLGQKRPLFIHLPENEIPKETKHKKQVWE